MRKFVTAALLMLSLTACAGTDPHTSFAIEPGPLRADELPLEAYPQVGFNARVFDVVNQDMTAERNTELAGKVEPMPVDIISAYAARKFRATGGPFTTRFVIRQAQFNVRTARDTADNRILGMGETYGEAEMTTTITAMLAASKVTGEVANITATTTQSQRLSFNSSHGERRAAYMALMKRAIDALDAEFNQQLPLYFDGVVK